MKILLVLTILLCFSTICYSKTKTPQITYKNAKTRHKQLKIEIYDKIITPVLKESTLPIQEIIINFCPKILSSIKRGHGCDKENQGKLTISIIVNAFSERKPDQSNDITGFSAESFIEITKDKGIDKDEYLRLVPKRVLNWIK